MWFHLRIASDEEVIATRESLRNPDSPDIGWIPSNVPERAAAASTLSEEDLERVGNP